MSEDLRFKTWPVLDDGHVQLIDWMGDDQSIVDAARVCYGKGTKRTSEDRDLIRFLMRHHHATPFEMAEIKIRVRVPMDCWRQWIRHRTANVNEYSTRYSEAIDSAQRTPPDQWRLQSTANKQGSGGFLPATTEGRVVGAETIAEMKEWSGEKLSREEEVFQRRAREVYERRLSAGVAREQARKDLPLSTYTEAYWKCDLRNVLGFLALRMDSHAQLEIRQYANVIGNEIVAKLFPITWEAFQDYILNAVTLSAVDIKGLRFAVNRSLSEDEFSRGMEERIANKRDREECIAKLKRLGITY